jgi:hypothetical protein
MRYMRNSGRQPPARSCAGCTFRTRQRPPRSAAWKSAPSNNRSLRRQTSAIRALHAPRSQLSRLVRKLCGGQLGNKWQLDRCTQMAQRSTKVSRSIRLVNGVVAAIQRGQHDDAVHHSSDITNEVVLHLAMRVAGKVGREDIPADETISADLMLRCVLLSSD